MAQPLQTIEKPVAEVITDHYIIVIGASAGGLEAIQEFFDNMPTNGNLSFIIIQHLSPDYKSLLVQIIGKHTFMKVKEAGHEMPVEKSCVYVIPNNKLLTIKNGLLQLNEKNFERAPNTAIDTFLYSLAKDQGSKAIAVILSGTGSDGSKGIEAIQAANGMVMVQDPLSAKFDGMPNSAIASGFADYILVPELMPEEIFTYINEPPIRIAMEGRPDENFLPEILKLVEKSCKHDFVNYKTPTILRRIGRRMTQLGFKNFNKYLDLLRRSADECSYLGKEFLIGVTKFFRDQAAFDQLRNHALRDIIVNKKDGDTIKVWVAACSTGEEAYTMAIIIDDLLLELDKKLEVKIFATDLDIEAVEFAAKGLYPEQNVAEIEPALLKRYFIKQDGMVLVHPQLRKQIVFARHNLLKDPPFIKNDLISCRNMLIYLNTVLQRRVFSTFLFSLHTGGYLFLGPSEIPTSIKESLEEVSGKWKLYRKTADSSGYNPERFPTTQNIRPVREMRTPLLRDNTIAKEIADDFKNILIEEYGFAAVYVDRNGEVKEGIGDYKKYLSLPDKIMQLQLLKMVTPEVATFLGNALRQVIKEGKKITLPNLRTRGVADDKGVNVMIKPAQKDGLYLVAFSEAFASSMANFTPLEATSETSTYVSELEEDLKITRNSLELAVENMETANEELQSSNEELLSANEELQSSNEELQSLNEELHTLNTEHQLRIKELIQLNDDLNNYFRSTEIAQIFVDSSLRIRKFNPAAVQIVNLIETDLGRPIEHISTNISNTTIYHDIIQVLKEETIVEKEVVLSNGRICLVRILPYIKQDGRIDGVVITMVDVSGMKEKDNIIKAVFNSSPNCILAFHAVRTQDTIIDFTLLAANQLSQKIFTADELQQGNSLKEKFALLTSKISFDALAKTLQEDIPFTNEFLFPYEGIAEWFSVTVTRMGRDGIVINLATIHARKMAEEKFRKAYHELLKSKESYRNLNTQLEEKVEERTYALTQTEERFRLIANATSDAIWDWDLVNNKLWWSDSFYKLFGYQPGDATATSTFWLDNIHPAEKDRVHKLIHQAINSGDANWQDRYQFKKSDGSYALIFDRGAVLTDEEGTPYRMVGAMMDITESEASALLLQQKNNELQKLIDEFTFVTDFMPQMVWATEPDGYHDFYNKGWYNYTGLTYEQTKDRGWSLVLHPQDYDRTWQVWKHSLETGELYDIEYRMKRYDGEYRWFLARALPMRDQKGKIIKWFGTCTDIQEQKNAADILEAKVKERTEALLKANTELEISNTELLQFASVASHDLKEPLRKIHMFSKLIMDRYPEKMNGGPADYLERIIASSARMTRLINDLMDFTRLSMNSKFELTSLQAIVEEVVSDLEVSIEEKGAKIITGNLPDVEVIPGQIRQVFQNIISNALKFIHADIKPVISIQAEYIAGGALQAAPLANGRYCRIVIADNGIGFDNKYAQKIFAIFQRLHAREKFDGTGIGLAITRKIIERHHGLVAADSEEGEGSRFIIVLPLKQKPENLVVE